jgi:2-keto-4-pentenoate hydratase/2-oxohepta-3-ene-1,7-dioic acid hydratase in catechol pathway
MKIANVDHRAALVLGDEIADVAVASGGRFGPDLMDVYEQWDEVAQWAAGVSATTAPLDRTLLRCPVPNPRQVFAIGLNYRTHAEESGMQIPSVPATFTKFPASLAGPFDDISLVGSANDWEVELVAVIGRRADRVAESDGWAHVAGLTIGQDISDRRLQFAAAGQFSLGKSRRGYGPLGPWVVSIDGLTDPDDLALGCSIDGETVQDARTSDLIFTGRVRLKHDERWISFDEMIYRRSAAQSLLECISSWRKLLKNLNSCGAQSALSLAQLMFIMGEGHVRIFVSDANSLAGQNWKQFVKTGRNWSERQHKKGAIPIADKISQGRIYEQEVLENLQRDNRGRGEAEKKVAAEADKSVSHVRAYIKLFKDSLKK